MWMIGSVDIFIPGTISGLDINGKFCKRLKKLEFLFAKLGMWGFTLIKKVSSILYEKQSIGS